MTDPEPTFTVVKDAAGNLKVISIEKKSTYDKWITLKKVLSQGGLVGLVAFSTYMVDVGFSELTIGYPEYSMIILTISAFVTGILNWYKHRKDSEIVKVEYTPKEI